MGSGSVVNYGDNNKHIIASMASVTTKTDFLPTLLGMDCIYSKKKSRPFCLLCIRRKGRDSTDEVGEPIPNKKAQDDKSEQ